MTEIIPFYVQGREENTWTLCGHVPASNWLDWRPYSAQTGERVGYIRDGAVYVRDFTLGLHWPDKWGKDFSPKY